MERAGTKAQTLARRRGSELSDSLEPALPELEISWVSKEREELEEVEYQLPSQQGLFLLLIKKT